MPKYRVSYYEKYEAVVEAENEQRAKEIADCASSEYVGCEDGDVVEVRGENDPPTTIEGEEPKVWEPYIRKVFDL